MRANKRESERERVCSAPAQNPSHLLTEFPPRVDPARHETMHLHPSCSETNLCPNSPYYKPLSKSASSGITAAAAAPASGGTIVPSGGGSAQHKHSPLIGGGAGNTGANIFNGLSAFAATGGGGGGGFGAANRTSAYLADEGAAIVSDLGDRY